MEDIKKMTEYELLVAYRNVESDLRIEGYNVNPVKTGFYVTHKGLQVCKCPTVDSLRGFLQAVQYERSLGTDGALT